MALGDPSGLTGGRLDWAEARRLLAGATCLWQDLDGLHVAATPDAAPPTSILWAWWHASEKVARLRLEGNVCYAAITKMPPNPTRTVPWSAEDGRIAHYDATKPQAPLVDTQFEIGVLQLPDPATGSAEVTFIRPARKVM